MDIETLYNSRNIAELLDDNELDNIGKRCLDDLMIDLHSRKPWEIKMTEAMKIAIQLAETKTTPWPKASNVKFPMLSIACIQFQSRIFPQLFSSPKPVKMRVVGRDPDSKKHNRAHRVSDHMSYQVTEQDEGWLTEHDKLMITLPLIGCGFIKTYFDGINRSEHVHAKDLVVNYYAKSLDSVARYTHIIPMYQNEVIERQRKKIYLDHKWIDTPIPPTQFQQLQDDYEGKQVPMNDSDAPRNFYEQYCWLDLDGDNYKEPYTVTFDDWGKVYRIVNRFASIERDGNTILKITPKSYFTKYPFIPSPDGGFYGLGFGSLLTPLNESVNTLINQLIDSGTLSIRQGGFIGRGARLKGGTLRFKMGEFTKVDCTGDDMRKNIFPWPFKEPSGTLFTLLNYLVEYGERLSSVSDMMVGKTPGQNTPATTAMAALEEGLKVITAIYQRIYKSLRQEFQKLYKLNQEFLDPEEYYIIEDDQRAVYQEDYLGDPTDIRPAADPSMSSDTQRLTRLQAIMQRAQSVPGYNVVAIERRFLEQINMEGVDEIYPVGPNGQPAIQPPPDPKIEIESHKFQADQMAKAKELQIKAALADSEIAIKETQSVLNLAKAQHLGDKNEIDAYKTLLDQLRMQREALKGELQQSQGESYMRHANG